MSFDLAKLETRTLSEAGVPMQLIHPKTRAPVVRDDAGTVVTITLLGRSSDAYRALQRQIQEERAQRGSRGIKTTQDDIEQEDTRVLVECTKAWTIDSLDNEVFPFTKENAYRLWTDKRFLWLRERAVLFIQEDGNFLAS